jgi:DNA-binding NarL/FixJ family response regulator
VLLDYDGPGMEGLDGLTRMIQANGGSVALFSGVANWSIVERAVKLGASGFIPKTLPVRTLGHAIRFIVDGELYLPSEFMLHKPDGANEFGLKPREMRALALLCEGKQNKEIGAELGVEETTVKADVKSICRKMGVRNRTEAVIKAIKMGMG